MANVIIYTNSNGGVSICIPTGEVSLEVVQTKDTPTGSIIVDDSTLPQGSDAQFFDSWVLNGSTVTVDQSKALAQATTQLNQLAYTEASHRSSKLGAGLNNVLSDSDWANLLTTARTALSSATTTQALLDAIAPIQTAITANAL